MSKMMTGEDLKNSILQMAIQGKLVEQRAEEGTGEELYQEIQKEKAKLIKEGKIKKDKKLPPITEDEIPFEIPESWVWVRFCDICDVLNGDRGKNYPAKSTLSHTGIPFISALNLDGKTVVADDQLLCLSQEQYDRLGNGKLNKGDIVVCIRGSLGKHGRYPFERGAIASSLVICRQYIVDEITAIYIMLFLDAPLFFDQIKQYDNGTAQPNLAAKSLEQFIIPLPPLAEQKRIVTKIEELMPFVEQYSTTANALTTLNTSFPSDLKKSILQMAVEGKLVPQDPNDEPASVLLEKIKAEKEKLVKEGKIKKQKMLPPITETDKPFDIPESWEWVRFSNIMNTISTGPFGTMLHKTDYVNDGIPIVNPMHMQSRKIVPSDNARVSIDTAQRLSAYKLTKGDIVLARRGEIGRSAIVTEAEEGWLCGTGSFFLTPEIGINGEFVSLMFLSPYVQNALLGESVGTTMNNLNQNILNSFLFPVPPTNEQLRICECYRIVLPIINKLAA